MPGITRVRSGAKAFRYRLPDGQWLQDPDEVARINRLAIPPAYTDVWICPLPHGHLQATGLDARGRRQYRYHPQWRAQRDEGKFEHMQAFGRVLPRLRSRVAREGPNTYDAHAHGPTTVLSVAEGVFRQLLREHPEFGEALLTLQARRMRYLYWMMEDMATLPLRARLAKQLLHVLRRFGERAAVPGQRGAIGLALVQDELAQLLGGSRQRINVELKWMEREGIIGIHQRSIAVYQQDQLEALAQQA